MFAILCSAAAGTTMRSGNASKADAKICQVDATEVELLSRLIE